MPRSRGEGSITQRKDGLWQAAIQIDGKRRTVYGKTRKEAADKLAELQRQARASGALPDPGRRSLNDLLDAWLDNKTPHVRPRTLADYRYTVDHYVRPTLGGVRLNRLTVERIARLLADLEAEGKGRTAQLVYRRLSQALDLAVRWAWLPMNPIDRVDAPRHRPERKEVWTADELAAFLTGTRDHWLHPLWVTAIATGCRLGELLALTWADVDLEGGTIAVTKSTQRIEGQRVTTTPKTASGRRAIGLPAEAVEALKVQRAWVAERRLRLGPDWRAGASVFPSAAGQPLHHSTVEHAIKRECARLGIPPVTPHGLRHLHASLLLDEGLPIPAVSARLGHANPSITLSTYSHAIAGQDDAAAAAIERALSSAVGFGER